MLNILINILIALCAVYRPSTVVTDAVGMRIWSRRLEGGPDWSYELQLYIQHNGRYRLTLVNLATRDKTQSHHCTLWAALKRAQELVVGFKRRKSRLAQKPNDLTDTIASQEQPFGAVALSGATECAAPTMTQAMPSPRTHRGRRSPNSVSSTMLALPALSAVRRWRRH